MLLAGDELGHTQKGNNNTYCQDNELTWLNWELTKEQKQFLTFVRELIELRHDQPVFRRRHFFLGRRIRGSDVKDVTWYTPGGEEMNDEAWNAGFVRCLGVRWAGDAIAEVDERGERVVGDTFLILLNAHHEAIAFQVPTHRPGVPWELVFDTARLDVDSWPVAPGTAYDLKGRSLAVLKVPTKEEE
jgi:glycogen operon protein